MSTAIFLMHVNFFKAMNEAQVESIVMEAFARFSCEIELLPTNEPWHFSLVR